MQKRCHRCKTEQKSLKKKKLGSFFFERETKFYQKKQKMYEKQLTYLFKEKGSQRIIEIEICKNIHNMYVFTYFYFYFPL